MNLKRSVGTILPFILVASFALSCSSSKPAAPPYPCDPELCGMGMSLEMREKLGPFPTGTNRAHIVLFLRLDEGETVDDLGDKDDLIPSTLVDDEYAYLLNVEPGTYVAVAAIYGEESEPITVSTPTMDVGGGFGVGFSMDLFDEEVIYRNYFCHEMICESMTTVGPGCFGFMGRFNADQSFRFGDADSCQIHIMRLIEGEDVKRRSFWNDIGADGHAKRLKPTKIEKDEKALREFCKNAKKHLKDTNWVAVVDRLRAGS